MRTIIREMRGIPYFLLEEYLVEMGGIVKGDGIIAGDGWNVKLTRMEPFKFHSLSVGQTSMRMELDENVADEFLNRFAMKTLRAGA